MKRIFKYVVDTLLESAFITLCCAIAYAGIQVGRPVWLSIIFPGVLFLTFELLHYFLLWLSVRSDTNEKIRKFKEAIEVLKGDAGDDSEK